MKIGESKGCADEAYKKIVSAWQNNEPAIVNTHRVNYVHLDKKIIEEDIGQLDWLLNRIQTEHPEVVYLTDSEVAQLYQYGKSNIMFGDTIICRNFTLKNATLQIKIPQNKRVDYVKSLPDKRLISFDSKGYVLQLTVPEGSYIVQLHER